MRSVKAVSPSSGVRKRTETPSPGEDLGVAAARALRDVEVVVGLGAATGAAHAIAMEKHLPQHMAASQRRGRETEGAGHGRTGFRRILDE